MRNNITPAQFVKDNLPNHEERFCKWVNGDNGIGCMSPESFHGHHFPEALENFRQSLWRDACEAMRKECILAYRQAPATVDDEIGAMSRVPIPNPNR